MTSAELKHQARLRDWAGAIRECRSSGQSVRQWCREKGITTTTYRYLTFVLKKAPKLSVQNADWAEKLTPEYVKAEVDKK